MSAQRWGIWDSRRSSWLTRTYAGNVGTIWWWPTYDEAAKAAAELNLGFEDTPYTVQPLASL
jgi:hypothetical protein